MKRIDWKFVAESTGIVAIVASLVFVGLEMRQTRMLAMATAYQARTDSEIALELALLQLDTFKQIRRKILTGQDLSEEEWRDFKSLINARLIYWENAHYQWQNELLTDEYWEIQLNSIRGFLINPHSTRHWRESRHLYRESFRNIIDEIVSEWDDIPAN